MAENDIQDTLNEREGTHGRFSENTITMQALKREMRNTPNWQRMDPYQREALDMIAHKIGRLLHGDPDLIDSWHDISGYATLVVMELTPSCGPQKETK